MSQKKRSSALPGAVVMSMGTGSRCDSYWLCDPGESYLTSLCFHVLSCEMKPIVRTK